MKKLLLIAGLCLSALVSARADIAASNMVSYAATGGPVTNNGAPVLIGTAFVPTIPSFLVDDGGVGNTNALAVRVQLGLDTNYFSTVATYTKSATNPASGVVSLAGLTVNIYANARVETTNSVPVGVKALFSR